MCFFVIVLFVRPVDGLRAFFCFVRLLVLSHCRLFVGLSFCFLVSLCLWFIAFAFRCFVGYVFLWLFCLVIICDVVCVCLCFLVLLFVGLFVDVFGGVLAGLLVGLRDGVLDVWLVCLLACLCFFFVWGVSLCGWLIDRFVGRLVVCPCLCSFVVFVALVFACMYGNCLCLCACLFVSLLSCLLVYMLVCLFVCVCVFQHVFGCLCAYLLVACVVAR